MRALVLRLPLPTSSRSRYYLVSGTLHVLFALALIVSPLFRPARAPIDAPLVVDVVGSLPGAESVAPRPDPPKPEPKTQTPPEPAEGVRAEPREVTPAPKEPQERKPKTEPKPATSPPRVQVAVGAPSGGAAITSLDLGEMEQVWYRDSVVAALQSHWSRPVLESAQDNWEVTVAFEILRDGSARNPRIEAASGIPSLDRSALRAVADASPFPPLPASWREPAVTARFVFRLYPGAD